MGRGMVAPESSTDPVSRFPVQLRNTLAFRCPSVSKLSYLRWEELAIPPSEGGTVFSQGLHLCHHDRGVSLKVLKAFVVPTLPLIRNVEREACQFFPQYRLVHL